MRKLRQSFQGSKGWTIGTVANLVVMSFLVSSTLAQAQQPDQTGQQDTSSHKITICHATSSNTNPFVTIHVDQHATNGHFDNNGTTLAGHEGDFIIDSPDAQCPGAQGEQTGTIIIKKVVSGGDAVAGDFSLHLMSNNSDVSGSPQAGSSTGTSYTVQAGNYTVSESGGPSNYTASFSSDCSGGDITLAASQNLTCTVTNTFNNGQNNSNVDLAVTKSVSNNSPFVGNGINYTVTVTNNSSANNGTGVTLTDVLPSGLTFVSSNTATGSFNSGTGHWTIGNLAHGASATLTVAATVNTGTGGNTITNTATVSGNETDTNMANNSASASLTVQSNPANPNSIDLAVTKTVNNSNPSESDNVTYTITVTNNGPHSASNVVLNDVLPAGITFGSSVVGQGSFNSGSGAWTIGSLNNGASATMTITAGVNTGTGGSTITNTATVSGTETDNNSSNNSASASLTVGSVLGEATTDLAVTKTVSSGSPSHNSNVTYTITVTNHGPGAATGVVLTDVLPTGTDFVSATTASGSFNSGTGAWTIGNLADNQSVTLSIIAKASADRGTKVTNTASVTGNEQDTDTSNNSASANFTVRRSSGGGGGGSSNNNGQVLGESTNVPFTSISMPTNTSVNGSSNESPAVLGESVELPRTGTSASVWLLLFLLLAIPFALQRQIND